MRISFLRYQQQLSNKLKQKVMNRMMSTQQIKRGLQNIKKAQLQVLKQLKGDSYMLEQKQPRVSLKDNQQSNQNVHSITNVDRNRQTLSKNDKVNLNNFTNSSEQVSQGKSMQTNTSSSSLSSSAESIQRLNRQFSSQRQQLTKKFTQITNKLNTLQKQSLNNNNNKVEQRPYEHQVNQLKHKINTLQSENLGLKATNKDNSQRISQMQRTQKKITSQLQLKSKQLTILETETKSLRVQNTKLSRALKQQQYLSKQQATKLKQLFTKIKQQRDQKSQTRATQQSKSQTRATQQSRLNMDLMMKQVKTISSCHDFLFTKLRQSSTTMQMSLVERQSEIQSSFSRLLEYFEVISMSESEGNNGNGNQDDFSSGQKNQLVRELIGGKKPFMVAESRVEEREELEQFVREMDNTYRRGEMKQLVEENQSLRRKVRELTLELADYQAQSNLQRATHNPPKYLTQSNRLISLQLQQMREQLQRLKRYKSQQKQQHQQQQKQIVKFKLRSRQLQSKLQSTQRKLVEAINHRYGLQKKIQQKELQTTELNSIIKQMTNKLTQSPQTSTLTHLRQQFSRLLQTNSLLQRQVQSLKAMNEALQSQISNLKYQKDQYQTNNKQKHQLIQREINQRNHLLEEMKKKDSIALELKTEIEKLKLSITANQQHFINQRQSYENLLQQNSQEILQLRKQTQDLYRQSRQTHQLTFLYDKLQAQYKQLYRKSTKMGETLMHLWSVKEAEYHNVNQILGMLKVNDNSNRPTQSQIRQEEEYY